MQTAPGTPSAVEISPATVMAEDDARLVASAQADAREFGPLYSRYADPVYRYCYRKLGHPETAADATAQVFVQALAALPGYRLRGASFRAWLFTIAHNVIVDHYRARRQVAPIAEAAHVPTAEPSPEERLLRDEAGSTVRALLATLPAEQRQILELRLAGLAGSEIAAVLGRTPGAVRVAQVRAIARLRETLASSDSNVQARGPR
ncbi:MAG: sigma-70 family RNA polymerase sigma factor [Chloroflexota bacterium]|nr:sigma-70 family RNA polymerase sigma factor [Chloroflexota bacterium]